MPGGKHVLGQGKNRIFGTGNEASGLVVTRPEILNDLADEILGKEEHKT